MSHSLYLHPADPQAEIDVDRLTGRLQTAGFLELKDHAPACPGPRLMEYITYLGCSPALSSGGVEAGLGLHRFDEPRWLGGDAFDRLRFPGCGHGITDGAALLQGSGEWRCPDCGNSGRLEDIAWRRSAAQARLFIEIAPVFPREAVPADALLQLLGNASGTDWRWFYSRSRL